MTNPTGKELVSAGHAFAKAISMDTPLIVIAKMIGDLSTRLDCAIARGNALQQERDALMAENAAKGKCMAFFASVIKSGEAWSKTCQTEYDAASRGSPDTDAFLNAVRADAIASLWSESLRDVGRVLTEIRAFHDESEAGGIVHDEIKERIDDFVAQLRAPKGDSDAD